MTRTKLTDRKLPNYTSGEEIFNMVSHIAGGVFAISALVLCVCVAALRGNVRGVVSGAIYGSMMILLYCMSSIYHGLRTNISKKVFQVIDHCAVFLLIAGTYTPLILGRFCIEYPALAWSIFGVVWGFTILGIVLNAVDLRKFRIFSMICYIGTGWSIIVAVKQLISVLTVPGFVLIMAGGVAYTAGAVLYGVGKRVKYMHSVFHVLVLAGSILHFIAILMFIMPVK